MFAKLRNRGAVAIAGLLLVAFGFASGTAVMQGLAAPVAAQTTVATPASADEQAFSKIYNTVSPSVVSISVTGQNATDGNYSAMGTGFVLDTNGHIVTNNHVVDGANTIEINFLDGTIVAGKIVGLDPDSDLAVLQVDVPASELHPVTLGDSDSLFIGESTLAIGSPFGERWTLTSGIVSALNRTIQGLDQYSVGAAIQTDAAINPGNSGGPLLNLEGQVIGVNSQIAPGSNGANAGVGFAIPVNLVKRVTSQLIANGKVSYSYLGIASGPEISLDVINALKLPNNLQGVLVSDVAQGGPADKAGLRAPTGSSRTSANGLTVPTSADIITAVDNRPITDMSGLISYLAINTAPGQTVNLTVYRDGQQINVPVTLGSRPTSVSS